MEAENSLPFELLPDGFKGIWLYHYPEAPENERWVIERLEYGSFSLFDRVTGPTSRAAFMAALAMIEAGCGRADPTLTPRASRGEAIHIDDLLPPPTWSWRLRRWWDYYRPWWRAPRPKRFPDWDD